jgi:hypothetical protein
MAKFTVGDKVTFKLNEDRLIVSNIKTSGIPSDLITHGNLQLHSTCTFGEVITYHNEYVIVKYLDKYERDVQIGFNESDLEHFTESNKIDADIIVSHKIGVIYYPQDEDEIRNFFIDARLTTPNRRYGQYKYYGVVSGKFQGTNSEGAFNELLTIQQVYDKYFNNNLKQPKNGSTEIKTREYEVRSKIITIRAGQGKIGTAIPSARRKATIASGHFRN